MLRPRPWRRLARPRATTAGRRGAARQPSARRARGQRRRQRTVKAVMVSRFSCPIRDFRWPPLYWVAGHLMIQLVPMVIYDTLRDQLLAMRGSTAAVVEFLRSARYSLG